MKLIATVVLGILSYSASAQSSQIGIETGAIASYSVNYFKDANPYGFIKTGKITLMTIVFFCVGKPKTVGPFKLM